MKGRLQIWAGLVGVIILVAAISQWASAAAIEPHHPQAQQDLLQALQQAAGGEIRLSHHSETGKVRFLGAMTKTGIANSSFSEGNLTADQTARSFLSQYGSLFGVADAHRDLSLMNERALDDGRSVVRYQQTYQGIPVLAGELMVQMNSGKSILSVNGEILPDIELDVTPVVAAETARQLALEKAAKDRGYEVSQLQVSEPELWIYDRALLGGPGPDFSSLVWRTEVTGVELLPIRELVLVDAHTGVIALNFNQVHMAKDRKTYDAGNTNTLPGTLRRSEGQGPVGDADVDNAHDYAGDTYDFFMNQHGRDSLDDAGMTLISTTDYCRPGASCPYANAFWNGVQMAYGDGFASADDVVGHELAHGFTEYTSNLLYYFQSGAINESFSDVWGEFVDLTNNSGTDDEDVRWQMGEDIPGFGAIRNMKDPTIFGDPDRIGSPNYYCGESDTGGVHWNSGVNNKAVYLMVDGDTFNGQTITAMGIPKVADLYYEVQTNHLTSGSNYADLYDALIQASFTLGYTAAERQNIQKALLAVEMNQAPCGNDPEPPVCPAGTSPLYVFNDNMENVASGNWTTGAIIGANHWYSPQIPNNVPPFYKWINFYANSGQYHLWGFSQANTADYFARMTNGVVIPANGYLRFAHDWNFEDVFDGGVVEYSVNGGSWTDAGSLFTHNGYNGTISSGYGNPLGGRSAFIFESYGYTTSRLNLSSLAGKNVRFRFRIGTDSLFDDYGWFVDDVQIYSCSTISYDYDMMLPTVLK